MRIALSVLSWICMASAALAQSGEVPLPVARRPLLLPQSVVQLDAGPRFPMNGSSLTVSSWEGGDRERHYALGMAAGLSAGILPELQAGVLFLPVSLAPDTYYGQPSLHLLYGPGQPPLGFFVELALPTRGDFGLTLGVPIGAVRGDTFRLTTGPYVHLSIDPDARVDLLLSAEALFNFDPTTFGGLEAALAFPAFESLDLPLRLFFGLSFPYGTRLLGDLRFTLQLNDLTDGFNSLALGVRLDLFFDV